MKNIEDIDFNFYKEYAYGYPNGIPITNIIVVIENISIVQDKSISKEITRNIDKD